MLNTTTLGESGPLVAFCHGLFGQGKNWTTIAKAVAEDHRVLLIDMPHHGRSEWPDHFDYVDVADQVAELFDAERPGRAGRSLDGRQGGDGAHAASPRAGRAAVRRGRGARGLRGAQRVRRLHRGDARAGPGRRSTAAATRTQRWSRPCRTGPYAAFLLQNLRRTDDGWAWQPNLEVLGRDLPKLGGWPEEALADAAPYDGTTLWIAGEKSAYVQDEHAAEMSRWFPKVRRITIKGAGHWVHSEQPQIFTEVLRRFLA